VARVALAKGLERIADEWKLARERSGRVRKHAGHTRKEPVPPPTAVLVSLGICILSADLEGLAAGTNVKAVFAALRLPSYSPLQRHDEQAAVELNDEALLVRVLTTFDGTPMKDGDRDFTLKSVLLAYLSQGHLMGLSATEEGTAYELGFKIGSAEKKIEPETHLYDLLKKVVDNGRSAAGSRKPRCSAWSSASRRTGWWMVQRRRSSRRTARRMLTVTLATLAAAGVLSKEQAARVAEALAGKTVPPTLDETYEAIAQELKKEEKAEATE
jgi:hypothetical protein